MNARESVCDTLLSDSYWELEGMLESSVPEPKIAVDAFACVASSRTTSVRQAFKVLSAENAHYMHEAVQDGQTLPATDTDKVSLLRIVLDERRRHEDSNRKAVNDLASNRSFDHRAGQIEAIRWFQYASAEHEMVEDGVVTAVRKAVLYAQTAKSDQQFICVPASGIVKKDLIEMWHETKGIAPDPAFLLPTLKVGKVYHSEHKGRERLLRVTSADLFSSYRASESSQGGGGLSEFWKAIKLAVAARPAAIPLRHD